MICKLTKTTFDFNSKVAEGTHPLILNYDYQTLYRILQGILKSPRKLNKHNVIYLRLAVLRFLDEVIGIPFGTVSYRYDSEEQEYSVRTNTEEFNQKEFKEEIARTLFLFRETLPRFKKLKLKTIPCKKTVEFLQGVFFTYQEGAIYTPFRQYLEATLLSDKAIDVIVAYDMQPNNKNFNILQLVMMGQEELLEGSKAEADYPNNIKLRRIKDKLLAEAIDIPEELTHVQTKNSLASESDREYPTSPRINIKIR